LFLVADDPLGAEPGNNSAFLHHVDQKDKMCRLAMGLDQLTRTATNIPISEELRAPPLLRMHALLGNREQARHCL
jgi:hypothetical protein